MEKQMQIDLGDCSQCYFKYQIEDVLANGGTTIVQKLLHHFTMLANNILPEHDMFYDYVDFFLAIMLRIVCLTYRLK